MRSEKACSKLNPLDLADCDLVFGPVVKFGGPGRLMHSHLLGMLEPMRFEPTVGLLRKSTVYGLNGHRAIFVIDLPVATCEHTL